MMIDYQKDTALELCVQAVALAQAIGDDEIRADALVTQGVILATHGEAQGITMLEEALHLVGHRGRVASRAYTNLGIAWAEAGDYRRADAVLERGLEVAERDGEEQGARFMRGNRMGFRYVLGDWDGALALAERFLAEGADQYQASAAREVRARIAVARGDTATAMSEITRVVKHARSAGDSQLLWPALVAFARLARRAGCDEESRRATLEVVEAIARSESVGDVAEWHIELLLGLDALDRSSDGRKIVERVHEGLWRDACWATIEGDYVGVAETLARIGEQPLQAEMRLLGARTLTAEGRLVEAEE
ncbi:MAG: tetratricopeptide repeat protein, partial [Gaiellaceae bacterium]